MREIPVPVEVRVPLNNISAQNMKTKEKGPFVRGRHFVHQDFPEGTRVERVWIWQESNDCLWNMAGDHYGDPFLWEVIYEANQHLIDDPHVIYPKQRIMIPIIKKKTRHPKRKIKRKIEEP